MSDTTPQPSVPEQPPQPASADAPVAPGVAPLEPQPVEMQAVAPEPAAEPPVEPQPEAEPQLTASEPQPVIEPALVPETALALDATQPVAAPAPPPATAPAFPGEQPVVAQAPVVASTAQIAQPTLPEPAPQPEPIYLSAPVPPLPRSNRVFGLLIVLLSAIVYVVLDAAAVYLAIAALYSSADAEKFVERYLQDWYFWVPFAVFVLAFLALVAIVNRGRWWAYVLGSLFVAVLVFAGFLGALLIELKAWNFSFNDALALLRQHLNQTAAYPWVALLSTFIALELVTWAGLWISARGAAIKRRNAEERAAFDAQFTAPAVPAVPLTPGV